MLEDYAVIIANAVTLRHLRRNVQILNALMMKNANHRSAQRKENALKDNANMMGKTIKTNAISQSAIKIKIALKTYLNNGV